MTSHSSGRSPAEAWPADLLDRFGTAGEIGISTRRGDGTLRSC
jgi:hypothetical protein